MQVHHVRVADFFSASNIYYASNRTTGRNYSSEVFKELDDAAAMNVVQDFCEVAVLLLIVVTFTIVAVACARRIRNAMLLIGDHSSAGTAMQAGKLLRRKILVTAGFVLVCFGIRCAYSTMFAVANRLQNVNNEDGRCALKPKGLCDSCYNTYTHIQRWMLRTPGIEHSSFTNFTALMLSLSLSEFHMTIVLISSPLALLVSFWVMTPNSLMQPVSVKKETRLQPSTQRIPLINEQQLRHLAL